MQNSYNANCTPKYLFVEIYFESWDPKVHGTCIYLQSFYVAALIDECETNKHYPLVMFINGISKKTKSSPLSSSNSESSSKIKKSSMKNCHAMLRIYIYQLSTSYKG